MRWLATAIGVCVWAAAATATADTTCKESARFVAEGSASLAPVAECGSYILATEAAQSPWSWGSAIYRGPLPASYELSLRYTRLTADRRPVEFHLPGGVVLISSRAFGFYESEAQFARDSWTKIPSHTNLREHTVRIVHKQRHAHVWLDGKLLGDKEFRDRGASRVLRIGLKGYQGVRARVLLRDVRVRPAQ